MRRTKKVVTHEIRLPTEHGIMIITAPNVRDLRKQLVLVKHFQEGKIGKTRKKSSN